MATEQADKGRITASWVTPRFAAEVRELAERDHRSVGSLIRLAVEDRLATSAPPAIDKMASPS